MARKDLKKLLAGLGAAGLISTGGIILPNAHSIILHVSPFSFILISSLIWERL